MVQFVLNSQWKVRVFRCHLETEPFDHSGQERKEGNEIKGAVFLQKGLLKSTLLTHRVGEGTISVVKHHLGRQQIKQHGNGYNSNGTFTEDG